MKTKDYKLRLTMPACEAGRVAKKQKKQPVLTYINEDLLAVLDFKQLA